MKSFDDTCTQANATKQNTTVKCSQNFQQECENEKYQTCFDKSLYHVPTHLLTGTLLQLSQALVLMTIKLHLIQANESIATISNSCLRNTLLSNHNDKIKFDFQKLLDQHITILSC